MTTPDEREQRMQAAARKAYYVEETRKGVTHFLVYARTAKEAAAKVRHGGHDDVSALDWQDDPGGIRSVRRAPEEDR